MKKAKRLLAALLSVVMILSAACIPAYAHKDETDNWYQPQVGSDGKYFFTYEQGAAYLLDMLDDMLKEANIYIGLRELDDMITTTIHVFSDTLAMDDDLPNGIDFRSVNAIIDTLKGLEEGLDEAVLVPVAKPFMGSLLDDYAIGQMGRLDRNVKRYNGINTDREVLEMLIGFLYDKKQLLTEIIAGTFDFGYLDGTIDDLIADLLPGGDAQNLDIGLKNMLYQMLVDETATIPEGETIDDAVQKVINWALIEGTGTSPDTGSTSLLGENFEPLMPAIADQPGGAGVLITPDDETFSADRDLDGVDETGLKMNTYQFVANLIKALMDGMLGPMLSELLCDLVGVEITEQYPYGDPAIMNDQMFSLIVGLVESLLTQNGAPDPVYTDDENTYPKLKIDAMIDWLFNGGGLDTFIKIDYQGLHIQDNFMSLLNDLIRLLVNMLPSLGLFESSAHLGYTADQLNAVWGYDANYQLIDENDEASLGQSYITYETKEIVYPTEISMVDGVETPTAYNYLSTQMPVNISDESAADYVNPDFIRVNYVVSTTQVYATVIKMALNDMIDGCYFPEWANDIPSVLAYGLAALAAPATPQNDYYERLDAYHTLTLNGGVGVVVDANNDAIDPIPYATVKSIEIKNMDGTVKERRDVTVPTGALNIGCSYLAAYLNTLVQLNDHGYFSTDTTLEKFASEVLIWGFTQYVPLLSGKDQDANGVIDSYIKDSSNADVKNPDTGAYVTTIWGADVQAFVESVADNFTNFKNRVYKETANFDAIYDLIDATVFGLLPTSWLPDINGSAQFINDWLLGNLIEFNLQDILGLLGVNNDSEAELNKYPLIPLIIRVLDRIFAAVFGDTGLLIPANRTGVVKSDNVTTMTTLDELLSCKVNGSASTSASLPYLVGQLLTMLECFKVPLLSTLLPLIASTDYERPYDTEYLTTKYSITDLENYVFGLTTNLNATPITSFDNESDANAAIDGTAKVQRTVDATAYEILLSNGTVYGPYATKAEADELLEVLSKCYIYAEPAGESIDDQTGETVKNYIYHAYRPWSYLETATKTAATETIDNKYVDNYSEYDLFKFSNLTARSTTNPLVSYESDQMYFFNYEDFGTSGYAFRNAKDAIDEGSAYVSEYNDYALNTLPAAYGEWLMFSVRQRLRAADLYDGNDDGYSVLSNTDTDYKEEQTTDADGNAVTNVIVPVDGDPGIPSSVYPFSTTSTTAYTYKDPKIGENITVTMDSIKATNYEQIALAVSYGDYPANDVTLTAFEAEDVVRLALGTMAFDITPKADGSYNAGSAQWETLTADQITTITTFCTNNGFKLEADEENGGYVIKRSAFEYTTNLSFSDISATPLTDSEYAGYADDTMAQQDEYTFADEIKIQIYRSYVDYIRDIYTNDRSIYNKIDYISFRIEEAEKVRRTGTDTTMLDWVINLTKDAYKDPDSRRRNLVKIGADQTTGEPITQKVYTTTSYETFREAYDFGKSLSDECANQILSDNEITQSLITEAYLGILKSYFALIEYTGDADRTQLNAFIATAEAILADPNKDDPVLGYKSGLDVLEATLADAIVVRDDQTIDCESQSEVDQMAAYLNQAIKGLVYNVAPSIVVNTGLGENAVGTVKISNENNRIVGQVFGLEEGVGAIMDIISLAGMKEDETAGDSITIVGSGHGLGTGAYYLGMMGKTSERFRYYAVLYGDINGDARIDGTDVVALELYDALDTVNAGAMGTARYEAADANRDGKVDHFDVDAIDKHRTFTKVENEDGTTSIYVIDQKEHSSGFTTADGDSSLIDEAATAVTE